MKCKKCGGNMVGNGDNTPLHCETLTVVNNELFIEETGTTLIFEGDCNPVHCDVLDKDIDELLIEKTNTTLIKVKNLNQHAHNASLMRALIGIRTAFSMLIYTPDNAELLRSYDNNHHAGGVMDHLASLIDNLDTLNTTNKETTR